jgi:DNA-binding IscR family transcriptional regulator
MNEEITKQVMSLLKEHREGMSLEQIYNVIMHKISINDLGSLLEQMEKVGLITSKLKITGIAGGYKLYRLKVTR